MTGRYFPKRREIYCVNLDPSLGAETKKTRPGLVISNDIGNEFSTVVMIAPNTSKVKNIYPFEVDTLVHGKQAKIMLNQCRAIDKKRLLDKLDCAKKETMKAVDEALKIVFALD